MITRPGMETIASATRSPFVEQRAKTSITTLAAEKHLDPYKVARMLRAAADPDNYGHYVYRHTIGNLVFEFRLHRTSVSLYSVTQRF